MGLAMKQVNIHQVKTDLSKLVERAGRSSSRVPASLPPSSFR
jgi:hypothetical protein